MPTSAPGTIEAQKLRLEKKDCFLGGNIFYNTYHLNLLKKSGIYFASWKTLKILLKASSRKQFYFLTLSHTVLDSYATLLSHLQPLLLKKLAISAATRNSLAGNFILIYSIFSSFGQILFGWLSDRVRSVHFLTFGVGLTALGLSFLWVAPSPRVVYLLLTIGGLGIASFHPQATTYAGALATEGRGMGISIFLTGGNVGRALGPLVLMFIPYRYGLEYLVWEMIPGVLVALLVPRVLKIREVAGSHGYAAWKVGRGTETARTLLDCRPSTSATAQCAIYYCGTANCHSSRLGKFPVHLSG